jgi:hypothetical protein
MIDRTARALSIVLGLQVLVLVLLWAPWSDDSTGSAPGGALVPGLDVAAVTAVEIEDAAGRVRLSRSDEGWTVDDLDGFPADSERIERLLNEIADARVGHPVVRSARYHDALGVADAAAEARVRLFDGSGEALADVLLGTSPNFGERHVRLAGDDRVYEVERFDRWSVRSDADTWIDKALFPDVNAASVTRVRVSGPEGELALARTDDGAWEIESDSTGSLEDDAEELARRVDALVGLRLAEPAGPDAPSFADGEAAGRLELTVAGDGVAARTVTLLVGPEVAAADARRVARRLGRPHPVVLSSYEATRILEPGS